MWILEVHKWWLGMAPEEHGLQWPLRKVGLNFADVARFKGGRNGLWLFMVALSWCAPTSPKCVGHFSELCRDVAWFLGQVTTRHQLPNPTCKRKEASTATPTGTPDK